MSVSATTLLKLHDLQLAAVTRSGDRVVSATEKGAAAIEEVRATVPGTLEAIARTLEKLSAPATKIVGTPSEHRVAQLRRLRDWTEAQHKFQTGLLDAVLPGDQPVNVATVTPAS